MKSETQDAMRVSDSGALRRTTGLSIVADDLTGACDAAVAFTSCTPGVRVELERGGLQQEQSAQPQVRAFSTYTRDVAAQEAESHLCRTFEGLPAGDEVFKKIDSVFRGNTFVEISATLRSLPYDLAVIAPSYPALKRCMVAGVLHVDDIGGERTLPVAETLTTYGHRHHGVAAGLAGPELLRRMREALSTAHRTLLCDAEQQEDLERVVHAAHTLGVRTLWIGSGGLAHALAAERDGSGVNDSQTSDQTMKRRPGPVAYLIGSDHVVTQAQVAHLREQIAEMEQGCAEAAGHVPLLVEVVRNRTTEAEIRDALATGAQGEIGCLFITGGDTARFVCRALGIEALQLEGEITPGVCFGLAEGGPFAGVAVVVKSGGFGERDLLCHILKRFGPRKGWKA